MKLKKRSKNKILTAGKMGPLYCEVQAGKLVATTGALPCGIDNPLHLTGPQQLYTPARIQMPMVRKGFLAAPENPKGVRGQDDYVPISWSHAYDLIDAQHKRIRTTYGARSIYAGSYGWRSVGALHRAQHGLQRYMSMAGGYVDCSGDYSTGAAQVILPYVLGSSEVYQQQTAYPVILDHSDLVVFWGVNPLTCLKIAWNGADNEGLQFLQALKASNKTLIGIDPMRSETIAFFEDNIEWVAPNPQTDVALMLGIAHSLVINQWHDTKFLQRYTQGYAEFERYLLGMVDGVAKTARWASEISGVAEDKITSLAYAFSHHRTMLLAGWSMQRQQYGEQRHWMLTTLAAMLGQIGLAGGGFAFSYRLSQSGTPFKLTGLSNQLSPDAIASLKPTLGEQCGAGAVDSIPVTRLVEALEHPNQPYQHQGQNLIFPDLKMIWWAGGANFTHHQDTHRLISAWQRPECIVVSELYWTGAAKHADIVLPITTSFERNDLTVIGDYGQQYLVPMKQAVAPCDGARSDFSVFADLAERLTPNGYDAFCESKDEMQWLRHFYQQSIKNNKAYQHMNWPSFDEFWQQNAMLPLTAKAAARPFIRFEQFRQDPDAHPLATPSGKIEIYSNTIAGFNLKDCPPHPTWLVNHHIDHHLKTMADNTIENKPLLLLTAHSAYRLHSQFNYANASLGATVAGREPVIIHTDDALKRGITTGDLVRIYNDQGQILAGAKVTTEIKVGTICVHQGAWLDIDSDTGMCKNGNVNVLCPDLPSSRLANGCAANTGLVQIEKYQGKWPVVTAFLPPTTLSNQ